MAKVLGLDLGTNSIGWATMDTAQNKVLDCGVRIFLSPELNTPSKRRNARIARRTTTARPTQVTKTKTLSKSLPYIPLALSLTAVALAVFMDWQYWLNLASATFIAFLALIKK